MGKDGVSQLLRESILQLCKASMHTKHGFEVDGIVCITVPGDEDGIAETIVVKVHETIQNKTISDQGNSSRKRHGRSVFQDEARNDLDKKLRIDVDLEGESTDRDAAQYNSSDQDSNDDATLEDQSNDDSRDMNVEEEDEQEGENFVNIEPVKEERMSPASSSHGHINNGFLECEICHLLVPDNAALLGHLKNVHQGHMCAHCDKPFLSSAQLQQHILTHTAPPPPHPHTITQQVRVPPIQAAATVYKCGVCGMVYESEAAAKEHMMAEHKFGSRFLCVPCQEYFPNRSMFVAHRRAAHIEPYEVLCKTCLVGFQEVEYPRHRNDCSHAPIPVSVPPETHFMGDFSARNNIHTGSGPSAFEDYHARMSSHAGKSPRTKTILGSINTTHNNVDTLVNGEDGSRERSQTDQNEHKNYNDKSPSSQLVQGSHRAEIKEEDDGESSNEGNMADEALHSSAGSPHKPFFIQRKVIRPCVEGRTISNSVGMQLGPYRCSMCDILCDDINTFVEHSYTAHLRFVCTYCAQTFASRRNLKRHVRKHTGETPYICELCERSFYRDDDLRRHKVSMHEKYFSCEYCGLHVLLSKDELLEHLQIQHPDCPLSEPEIARHKVNDVKK